MRKAEELFEVFAIIVAMLFFAIYMCESIAHGSWLLALVFGVGVFAVVMAIRQAISERNHK